MTTWNYRLIKHDEDDPIWYGLHEVYYEENKDIRSWTDNPILISETAGGMIDLLEKIIDSLEARDVLIYSEIS